MYMQYFVGLSSFSTKEIFHHTEFVHIRRRLQDVDFNEMTAELMREAGIVKPQEDKNENPGDSNDTADTAATCTTPVQPDTTDTTAITPKTGPATVTANEGVMQLDATVSDQKIKYPNDVDLLNTGRQETDRMIDLLCMHLAKQKRPRTYRRIARKQYLRFAKKKTKTKKEIHKARKQQLQYLKRNLNRLDTLIEQYQTIKGTLLLPLSHRDLKILWATRAVYEQQLQMHEQNTQRVDDRIVSIYQPYVRPIVRGKAKHKTEFGNKNSISLQNGYVLLERLSWDAYNECNDLQPAAENYKQLHGHYPSVILCDAIYHTKANKDFCKQHHIRLMGKALSNAALKKMSAKERKEYRAFHHIRNHIEGKFGQGKSGYELNEIKARSAQTSNSWIASVYFVMNVLVFAAGSSFLSFFANTLQWLKHYTGFSSIYNASLQIIKNHKVEYGYL